MATKGEELLPYVMIDSIDWAPLRAFRSRPSTDRSHLYTVLSVPVKLLKEGEGHMVTVELKTGEVYRGLLVESEDTMNLHLSEGALLIGFIDVHSCIEAPRTRTTICGLYSIMSFVPTVTHTARNGKVSKLEQVYLRGSHLKFVVLPEILKNAPVFKKVRRWMDRWMNRLIAG